MSELSISNAKLIASLHLRKYRESEGMFVAEGKRMLDELAAHQHLVRFVFCTPADLDRLSTLFPGVTCYGIGTKHKNLFATEHPQGVGAVVQVPEPLDGWRAKNSGPYIYLDAISDPGNLGTILRSADWFNVAGVLISEESVDAFNPKSARASMGAVFRNQFIANVTREQLTSSGHEIIVLEARSAVSLSDTTLPRHAVYVVGSEAHGISDVLLDASDRSIAIHPRQRGPNESVPESLNAAVAASILCYHLGMY